MTYESKIGERSVDKIVVLHVAHLQTDLPEAGGVLVVQNVRRQLRDTATVAVQGTNK